MISKILVLWAISASAAFALEVPSDLTRETSNHSQEISNIAKGATVSSGNLGLMSIGSYFQWGQGQNGWGYCYEWTYSGQVLNGGQPVYNFYCEETNPSYHDWGTGRDEFGYCYQFTPYRIAMNEGMPQNNYDCEMNSPSHFSWARATNGYTYCFQFTPYNVVMNGGRPVPNEYCR